MLDFSQDFDMIFSLEIGLLLLDGLLLDKLLLDRLLLDGLLFDGLLLDGLRARFVVVF